MTQTTIHALYVLNDGRLVTSFHHTPEERTNAISEHVATLAQALGRNGDDFANRIDLEELYEQQTGKQLELLTEDITLSVAHPAVMQVKALIGRALLSLEDASKTKLTASEYLAQASALLKN
ncbi:hypothetical protein [uncultured Tateyamaria sp.]|uniref:hypothetical protein n=1 Tax=uncultured Tateyamaria sp. TaxID=455651 RepID=UPI0026378CEB|nr:hypothetical protein [uncultured Tateyamaria sp.]